MRNKPAKPEKTKHKKAVPFVPAPQNRDLLNVSGLCALIAACTLIFTLACNNSSRTAALQPGLGPTGNLVSEATRIIQEGLADQDPLVRVNCIEVVATTRQVRLMPKVKRLLADEFVPVRFAAALAVGDMEYALAKGALEQLFEDQDPNVRMAAAYALGKLGSFDSFEVLSKAVTSTDQTVRANAALLLGKSGDKEALKFLYWALRHNDSGDKVRFQAAESIAMLGDERIYPKLWTMLISAYADDRVVGIKAMGALGTERARSALVTMLDDKVLEVRLAAAEQLGMLGDTTGESVVLDVFTKNLTAGYDQRGLEFVNVLTALAIGRIGTPHITRSLPRLLQNESKFVRIAAAKAVFQSVTGN